ncbi:MAG TPA: EAL domain-containing protein, partial [Candidatus Limnocylindrales bacterium]|nr:EAL domain-containing protein [Candidatus Limnocylindrales bacterium]
VDILKIARDFVGSSEGGSDEWAFAHAIVALGQTLGLRIVAEGVEQAGQLQRLRLMGCDFGQGFLFARPAAGPEFTEAAFATAPGKSVGPVAEPAILGPRAVPRVDLRTA